MALEVFIVEDSQSVREIMLEQISMLPNVTCVGYADSEEVAVDTLKRVACDVVIVDINLKSGSGIGVLRALRNQVPEQKAARIVFSNYEDASLCTLSARLGAAHFLDKARDFPRLLSILSDMATVSH